MLAAARLHCSWLVRRDLLDLARLLHAAAVGLRAAAGALGDDGDGDDLMATRVRE